LTVSQSSVLTLFIFFEMHIILLFSGPLLSPELFLV
jgi:hypothetical protein